MNVHLAQPLLHFSPNSVVNLVQISTDGSDSSGEMKAEGEGCSLSHKLDVQEHCIAGI